ncbi:MAG TPA: hypothetical protein VIV58_10310 [Kofleriaceae bacterium]
MRVAWLLAVAACQQGVAPAAKPGSAAAPAPTAPPADAARAIDAPLDASDPTAHLFELPTAMATRDGKLVLVKVIDDDGARGAQNLALELRDRSDRVVERVVVLALDERADAATLARRAAAADALIESHQLVPLDELARTSDDDGEFAGAGMTVHWAHERFAFALNGKRVLDRPVPVKWRGTRYFSKLEDLTCNNPDFLRGVSASPANRLAVVDVAYKGNDTCWEPTGHAHVVTW